MKIAFDGLLLVAVWGVSMPQGGIRQRLQLDVGSGSHESARPLKAPRTGGVRQRLGSDNVVTKQSASARGGVQQRLAKRNRDDSINESLTIGKPLNR